MMCSRRSATRSGLPSRSTARHSSCSQMPLTSARSKSCQGSWPGSERLRVNDAKQPTTADERVNVWMFGAEQPGELFDNHLALRGCPFHRLLMQREQHVRATSQSIGMPLSQGKRKLIGSLLLQRPSISEIALTCQGSRQDHLRGQRIRMTCAEPGLQPLSGRPGTGQRRLVLLLQAQGGGYVDLADEGVRVSRPQPRLVDRKNGLRFRSRLLDPAQGQQVDRMAKAAGQRVGTVAAESPGQALPRLVNVLFRLIGMPATAQCRAEQGPCVQRGAVVVSECLAGFRPDGLHLGDRLRVITRLQQITRQG